MKTVRRPYLASISPTKGRSAGPASYLGQIALKAGILPWKGRACLQFSRWKKPSKALKQCRQFFTTPGWSHWFARKESGCFISVSNTPCSPWNCPHLAAFLRVRAGWGLPEVGQQQEARLQAGVLGQQRHSHTWAQRGEVAGQTPARLRRSL